MRMPAARSSRAWKAAGVALGGVGLVGASLATYTTASATIDNSANTTTPIKHVVVIYDENVSYDHYFGTYPTAANTDGARFYPAAGTPANNNLVSSGALTSNPNAVAPFRLSSSQALTCDQDHSYGHEQQAVDSGKMDLFVETVSRNAGCQNANGMFGTDGETMGYYDGNTVPAFWNLAQNYAMSDNSWDSTFGPSTPGAINLISGQTHGIVSYPAAGDDENPTPLGAPDSYTVADPNGSGVGTVVNDPDPVYDDCNNNNHATSYPVGGMQASNRNIGDLLTTKSVTWGWFQGGFAPTTAWAGPGTYAVCGAHHSNIGGNSSTDYSPHHNPFEYYASTANPHHFPGTPGVAIGAPDPTNDATKTGANHQYDLSVFDQAAQQGTLPAVSFVKAGEYQDGHPGYSDPTDEQNFIVHTINELERGPEWSSTAVVISYDDSDGWYDHVAPKITNSSTSTNDFGVCKDAAANVPAAGGYLDRCGPSQRLPLLVISPYAKRNFIDHTSTTQVSVLKFIESNWGTGGVGDSSFDGKALSLSNMFDFSGTPRTTPVILGADGTLPSTSTPPGNGQPSAACNTAAAALNSATAAVQADTRKVVSLRKQVKRFRKAHKAKQVKKAKARLRAAEAALTAARNAEATAQTVKAQACL